MRKTLVIALVSLFGMAGTALAQESAEAEAEVAAEESADEGAAEAEKLPFGGSLSLGSRVGMGTFANDGYARRPLMTGRLGMSAYYKPTAPQRISLGFGVTKYLVENADTGVAEDGQTLIEDLGLSYSYSGIWSDKDLGLSLSAGASLSFPTSKASQVATKILGVTPNARLSGNWGWFSAYYGISYTQNFHEYTNRVVENEGPEPICINREGLVSGVCFVPSYANTQFAVSNSVGVGFKALDELSFGISYSLFHSYGYDVYSTEDEFTSVNAQAGKRQRDGQAAAITASYQVHKYFGLGAALATGAPIKTADNKGFRFPFFDGSANNYSSVSLTATASY